MSGKFSIGSGNHRLISLIDSLVLYHHQRDHPTKICTLPGDALYSCAYSMLPSCFCSIYTRSHADSHHLCTDTAGLDTAVSEVAFLVQN